MIRAVLNNVNRTQLVSQIVMMLTVGTVTSPAFAALFDRGSGMLYDDVLDITWLQDANYAKTSGAHSHGGMTWEEAFNWVGQLNYGGYDDWRLPSAKLQSPVQVYNGYSGSFYDGSHDNGYNNTRSEFGHMFYTNLGNTGKHDTNGKRLFGEPTNTQFVDASTGSIENIVNLRTNVYRYWLNEQERREDQAWMFNPVTGMQFKHEKDFYGYAWAVRDGDVAVAPVPVPAAFWLLGSALAGLFGGFPMLRRAT